MQRPTRDEVRAAFVGIAARRFAENGYQATSVEEIAAEAGYSKAALLYHFGSKEDLLVAVMERHVAETDDVVASLETRQRGPARTEHAIATLVGFALERRPISPMPVSPLHDMATVLARRPELLADLHRTRQRMIELLVGPEPSLRQQIALATAFAGIPAVIAEFRRTATDDLSTILADVLRDAVRP